MARHSGPKNKLARQVGEDLGLKTNALKVAKRINIRPGQHGSKMRRKVSDYGQQLKEKQKLKYIYGIVERQLHKLYVQASEKEGATGSNLITLLERRLDNVVYRFGWAPTRAAARQMVNHGQVLVNDRKVGIPSYQVDANDVVVLKTKATAIPVVAALLKEEVRPAPAWLEKKAHTGKVTRLPQRADVQEVIDEQLIVEFYSR